MQYLICVVGDDPLGIHKADHVSSTGLEQDTSACPTQLQAASAEGM